MASAFLRYLDTLRDAKEVVFWTDNCASQNKNWFIITVMAHSVNKQDSQLNRVTLKFLEKGHTSMSADSVHQAVNKNRKRQHTITDFQDYKSAVQSASTAIEMQIGDFKDVGNAASASKLKTLAEDRPYLARCRVIQLRRVEDSLYQAESPNNDMAGV